MKGMENQN